MKKKYLLLIAFWSLQHLFAQTAPTVNVTVQVLPPYSTYLQDYLNTSNKVVISLLSYTNANVKLKASITGDNGITIATSDNYRPASPLVLNAYQQKMITGIDLKNYLDFNSSIVSGINKNALFRGSGIPEGNYTLCVQVLDYNTGNPLSDPEPLGCSNSFSIEQLTPPQLISPICNETLQSGPIQNIVFSWLPPQGAPAGSQYKLKIVELVPSTRNPNEAMNSATTPAFFETITHSFSLVYGPSQPLLKNGKKYAWRVTVLPPASGVRAGVPLNLQNNGNSEVCSFVYESKNLSQLPSLQNQNTIVLINPSNKEKISNGVELEFSWEASKKDVVNEYVVQYTSSVHEKKDIQQWSDVSESLFIDNYNYYKINAGKNKKAFLPIAIINQKGKYAWRVIAVDKNNSIVDKSNLGMFEISEMQDKDRIKILTPTQGEKIDGGVTVNYTWTASKNKSVEEYILQSTDITNKSELNENLFSNKGIYGIGPFKETSFTMKTQVDQDESIKAWRVIGLNKGKIVDSSLPSYIDFVKDKSDLANLKTLQFNDYTIEITKINDKNPDSYSGQGKVLLWENGPTISVWFKDLKIRPILYRPKTKTYIYAAVKGTIDMPADNAFPYKKNILNLSTNKESEGSFEIEFSQITFNADLQGKEGGNNGVFIVDENLGKNVAKVKSKWKTNFFIWKSGSSSRDEQYVFETALEQTVNLSFSNKIDGSINYATTKMTNLLNNGIDVNFDSNGVVAIIKGLEVKSSLSGKIIVPKASSKNASVKIETDGTSLSLTSLEIPFKEMANLNFSYKLETPLHWQINKDKSVYADIKEMYVHLSPEGVIRDKFKNYPYGLNLDKFLVEVKLPMKTGETKPSTINLSFDNIYNNGKGYTNNKKGENLVKSNTNIAGFTTKLDKSDFLIKYNKLVLLNVKGQIYVPFLNDWSLINLSIDENKLQEAYLIFDYNKKYYLSKNQSGSMAYFTISSGRFENNSIVVYPSLTIKDAKNKGFEAQNMSMCELFINPEGSVSYNTNFSLNSESVCEGTKKFATYYKFHFGVDRMKIKRGGTKTDADFLFVGEVNLGPEIEIHSKKEMGFKYKGIAPNPEKSVGDFYDVEILSKKNNVAYQLNKTKGGPYYETEHYTNPFENNITISDDGKGISGAYEDGAQKFGGGFKIAHDEKWGDYFILEGNYEAKQPVAKQLETKLILGKKTENKNDYTYWFFEFKQKDFVIIPIVPGIIEAHGFGGKAYYHMQPTYDNLGNITDLNPDNKISIGIVAEAFVRTAYDNGRTLHGHAQIVTELNGSSIKGIDYYIKADAINENSNASGMLQARFNGSLNWVNKCIDGKGQIWGKVKDIVCLNEGQANEDSIFFHFGADKFFVKMGTEENPIEAEVMCGSGLKMGVWFGIDKNKLDIGVKEHYDSGWKGLDLKVASAQGKLVTNLSAELTVQFSPFQATGKASFSGRAYGKGCVDTYLYEGCVSGSCGVGAELTATMPNPVVFEGSVSCDVSRWIPDFTLHARWSSNDGFSIWV
ncbi:TANFOR domain-containing protein [Flavobacterium sp. 9AF]|uniref:hypothetical protein n=1 Tax=Flavobacterium sp. 9AF TaxID=2653142 RepID=UPI0012F2900D|nr:hypothetical protein [Flavobacterium sp. 9AF]VXB22571.1 TANFOR domain-containing protein [Flavobacterium sp. 9AF]